MVSYSHRRVKLSLQALDASARFGSHRRRLKLHSFALCRGFGRLVCRGCGERAQRELVVFMHTGDMESELGKRTFISSQKLFQPTLPKHKYVRPRHRTSGCQVNVRDVTPIPILQTLHITSCIAKVLKVLDFIRGFLLWLSHRDAFDFLCRRFGARRCCSENVLTLRLGQARNTRTYWLWQASFFKGERKRAKREEGRGGRRVRGP